MGVRERLSAFGHTFGVRVDGAVPRGLWPPVGGRLCSLALRGQGERFLGLTGLMAGGFLSLTTFQAEGCGIALRAMSIKSALRAWLSMSYGMISILVISRCAAPPLSGCARTSPYAGAE